MSGYHGNTFFFKLADLPVSRILLIAISNDGTQWVYVGRGGGIVHSQFSKQCVLFVIISFFKNLKKMCIKPTNFNSENAKKISGISLPRGKAYSPMVFKKICPTLKMLTIFARMLHSRPER